LWQQQLEIGILQAQLEQQRQGALAARWNLIGELERQINPPAPVPEPQQAEPFDPDQTHIAWRL
jgi:hypothetical protein